jgi:hypothetical protein
VILQTQNIFIRTLTKSENTPELAKFWEAKYVALFENNLVKLDSDLQSLLEDQSDLVSFESVPRAKIVLEKHLDHYNQLDEDLLISTIKTSLRLLDGAVSYMARRHGQNSLRAKRVIALGVEIGEFFARVDEGSACRKPSYVSEFIGEKAYIFDEILAEEKGTFGEYERVNRVMRGNRFETWINDEGDTKNYKEKLENDGYMILARRNYAILDFPNKKGWRENSDAALIEGESHTVELVKSEEKPFEIKIAEPGSRAGNHIDEIFRELRKEREVELEKVSGGAIEVVKPQSGGDLQLFMVLENGGKFAFAREGDKLVLPNIGLETQNNIGKRFAAELLKKYDLLVEIESEIGSNISNNTEKKVCLGFGGKLKNHVLPSNLFWAGLENSDIIEEISASFATRSLTTAREIKAKKPKNFDLKIQKKLLTTRFGAVSLEFGYTKNVIQVLAWEFEIEDGIDKASLETLVKLINLMLQNRVDISEISVSIGEESDLNKFLMLITLALKEAPQSLQELVEDFE